MKPKWTLSEMKEIVLSLLAFVWGLMLVFPEQTLSTAAQFDLHSFYMGDTVWAVLLMAGSIFLLFFSRSKYFYLRRIVHAFLWIFWSGIAILVIVRSSSNGLNVSDVLISSPFLALAFIHAAFYMRLVYVK